MMMPNLFLEGLLLPGWKRSISLLHGRHMAMNRMNSLLFPLCSLLAAALLSGCTTLLAYSPVVKERPMTPAEYIAVKRGDILTRDELSGATLQTINIAGIEAEACRKRVDACIHELASAAGITDAQRQSALAELWLAAALAICRPERICAREKEAFADWMEVIRHSYSYLFFTGRSMSTRAFEDRQTQVRDYYNLAVQETSRLLFHGTHDGRDIPAEGIVQFAGWNVRVDISKLRLPGNAVSPRELVPVSSLSFSGLRSIYRRDGFGAELVAVTDDTPVMGAAVLPAPGAEGRLRRSRWSTGLWSEVPSMVINVLAHFDGGDPALAAARREVNFSVHDAYGATSVQLEGQQIPLAANFTAGYGLWLARSGFNRESVESLLGRGKGIERPHLYLMQPYDPDRRIIVMIHGLASSPEAWANVANELMGDEDIRRNFQIWQVYYPTNVPIPFNHYAIRNTLQSVMDHFDPTGNAVASRNTVLIGHSMGGVISRLLVSSSGDRFLRLAHDGGDADASALSHFQANLQPVYSFEPMPNVERAVFLAAPHRGTEVAGGWMARMFSRWIRLPKDLLSSLAQEQDASGDGRGVKKPLFTSVSNLDSDDPFIRIAADVPISPGIRYHSIIARSKPAETIEQSSDGLVPYWSAHLPAATSEKLIRSGHSVQETAPAIIELRRILHEDITQLGGVR